MNPRRRHVLLVTPTHAEMAPIRRRLAHRSAGACTVDFLVTGMGERCGRGVAQAEAAGRFDAVILAGFAGGLDESLAVGDVFVVGAVVDDTGAALELTPVDCGLPVRTVAHAGGVVSSAADKRSLQLRTGAAAVDMETLGVVRALAGGGDRACGQARSAPHPTSPKGAGERAAARLVVVRAVSDAAGVVMPVEAQGWVDALGRSRPLAVCASLVRRPGLLCDVLRLARDSRTAGAALGRAVAGVVEETDEHG